MINLPDNVGRRVWRYHWLCEKGHTELINEQDNKHLGSYKNE